MCLVYTWCVEKSRENEIETTKEKGDKKEEEKKNWRRTQRKRISMGQNRDGGEKNDASNEMQLKEIL